MIKWMYGNIFNSPASVLVCPTNIVGTLGGGLAKQFRSRYPTAAAGYVSACYEKRHDIGKPYLYQERSGVWIAFVATKKHWIHPTKLEYVRAAVDSIIDFMQNPDFLSVAVPALGCGLGGLAYAEVRPELLRLDVIPKTVSIYMPQE